MKDFEVGTVIDGSYRVAEVLRGVMGLIYVVDMLRIPDTFGAPTRRVLKTYPGAYSKSSQLFQRFIDEARLWLDISNAGIEPVLEPFIVRAYATRIIRDRPFIEIEYINNGHLGSLGLIPLPVKIDLAVQTCKGMGFLAKQKKGFVHGDLKPENLLCKQLNGGELIVKISDFGLSRFKQELASIKPSQSLLLADRVYSAPEFFSNTSPSDVRSDIFSFGLVLYGLLLNSPDHRLGRTEMAYLSHGFKFAKESPMNNPCAKTLPDDVRDILTACLQVDPARRYPSFIELEADLQQVIKARSWGWKDNLAAAGNVMTLDFDYFYKPIRTEADPADAAVHYASLGAWERAFALFDEALAQDPNDPEILTDKAHTLVDCGRPTDAMPLLQRAVALAPQNPIAWTVKGMAHDLLGEFDLALSSYDSAIKVDSTFTDAWMNKGNLLSNCGRLDDALLAFRQAVELGSSRATLWHNIGLTCEKLRDFGQAAEAYGKAYALNGDLNSAVCEANCLAKRGDFSSAETALRNILDVDEQNATAWAVLAAAYYNQGKWDACTDACDRVRQLDEPLYYRQELPKLHLTAIFRVISSKPPWPRPGSKL